MLESMLWMMSPLEIGDALTSMMGATTSAGDVFAVTATLEDTRMQAIEAPLVCSSSDT